MTERHDPSEMEKRSTKFMNVILIAGAIIVLILFISWIAQHPTEVVTFLKTFSRSLKK